MTRGERYALIPEEVLTSPAYCAQPDFAKVVLVALSARFNGHNNGDLSLIPKSARERGVSQEWKLYCGLALLRKADLIRCTRQGLIIGGARRICGLYALTWRGIEASPEGVAYDDGVSVCPIPSHAWVKWERPADWEKKVRQAKRAAQGKSKAATTTGVDARTYTGVAEKAKAGHTRVGEETAFPVQPMAVSSKTQVVEDAGPALRNGGHAPKSDPSPKIELNEPREIEGSAAKAPKSMRDIGDAAP
jgi:hypothetical protein